MLLSLYYLTKIYIDYYINMPIGCKYNIPSTEILCNYIKNRYSLLTLN